jgi:hypothetical protein
MEFREHKLAIQDQIQKGLIQVYVALEEEDGAKGESLLAYPIGGTYAQIASIPFFASSIGLDDIVETDISGDAVRDFRRIVKKNTDTFYVNFDATASETEKGEVLGNYLMRKGLRSESFAPGVFAIAVPIYFDKMELEEIVNLSPYHLVIEED